MLMPVSGAHRITASTFRPQLTQDAAVGILHPRKQRPDLQMSPVAFWLALKTGLRVD
jgi:hypothetical protein